MEWRLARVTANLNDDPPWEGVILGGATAPAVSSFFTIGVGGAQLYRERYVTIRIGWVNAVGSPVAIKGTCTAEPVSLSDLPRAPKTGETQVGQTQRMISVGAAVVDVAAWYPLPLLVEPWGQWTVRLSGMSAVGATRAAVWYLAHP